jgi:hypothetical protein
VIVPASSMATTVRQDALASVPLAPPETTITPSMAPTALSLPVEVAPVKPIGLDEPDLQWSASSMKSTKIASYLQATVVPFAFLAASAMTQIACAGGERQTPPEEERDPNERLCYANHWEGLQCPTRKEIENWGKAPCPDGTKDCQK